MDYYLNQQQYGSAPQGISQAAQCVAPKPPAPLPGLLSDIEARLSALVGSLTRTKDALDALTGSTPEKDGSNPSVGTVSAQLERISYLLGVAQDRAAIIEQLFV